MHCHAAGRVTVLTIIRPEAASFNNTTQALTSAVVPLFASVIYVSAIATA